jgi:hypothetical protein
MTLIDFADFKIRFDPKDVRISIDGDIIDIGARRTEEETEDDEQGKIIDLGDGTMINTKSRRRYIKKEGPTKWVFDGEKLLSETNKRIFTRNLNGEKIWTIPKENQSDQK